MGLCRLKHGLWVADLAFAWIIVFPMGVFYWRGTWDIWTSYVNLDCPIASSGNASDPDRPGTFRSLPGPRASDDDECVEVHGLWLSAVAGGAGMILINLFSPLLVKHVTPKKMHIVPFVLISRLYCYAMAFLNLGFWRGVWSMMDHYGEPDWRSNLIGLGAGLALAFTTRITIQAKSLPWEIGCELKMEQVFDQGTWFGSKPSKNGWWLWAMDQVLTVVLAQSLSIWVWRCMWNILDRTIITWDRLLSSGTTTAAGLGWLLILALVHFPVARLSARLDKGPLFWKLVLEDAWYILVNAGVLFAWRGMWYLVADYVFPDPVVGGWACHGIGFGVLTLLCQGNALFDNGVAVDGTESDGYAVQPKISFFQDIFKDQIAAQEKNADPNENGFGHSELPVYGVKNEADDGLYNNGYSATEKL